MSFIISSGFSFRGLSLVTTAIFESSPAIFPISGRLSLSRSPPHPKTRMIFPDAISRTAESMFLNPSGVWA